MMLDELEFHIDFKRKTFHVYFDGGEAEKITLDEEGAGVLKLTMFKSHTLGTLKGFIEKLNEILTKDQIQIIFQLWGDSNAVKISIVTAQLGGDRLLAKQVIDLALINRVLAVGVNSTYKIVNKEEQKTMKEYAERLKRGTVKEPETFVEIAERWKERDSSEEGKEEGAEGTLMKGGNLITKGTIKVIAETKDESQLTEQELREHISQLQQKLKDTKDSDWNEKETPWTVNDKIHRLQAQLKGIEVQKDAIKYKQEVNSLNSSVSKSMTKIEKKVIQPVMAQPQQKPTPTIKIPFMPKKKSLQAPISVVKKRS